MFIDPKLKITNRHFNEKAMNEKFSIFLLWLLSKKERHGYEIIKIVKDSSPLASIAASRVYPLLAQLSKKGLISYKKELHGKRASKHYYLSSKGKLALQNIKKFIQSNKLVVNFMEDMLK